MSVKTQEIAEMIELLPESEQELVFEMIKRIVLAWDPDYTRLTDTEKESLESSRNSGYVNSSDINWDELDKYAE